ncbi:MAG: hypothetical protein M9893_09475 [Pyrinomonadaceae bacterium]|nr:hypothetical protein [Pyrinomonadaceae bacterium]
MNKAGTQAAGLQEGGARFPDILCIIPTRECKQNLIMFKKFNKLLGVFADRPAFQKGADHCHAIRSRVENGRDILCRDPAYCNKGKAARHALDTRQEIDADHRIGLLLCSGSENRPERQIIDRLQNGCLCLFDGVGGDTDNHLFACDTACFSSRKIRLTEVNTVRPRRHGDIKPIVNDHRGVELMSIFDSAAGIVEPFAGTKLFFAKLDQCDAGIDQTDDLLGMSKAGYAAVCDRVNLWQRPKH